MSAVISLVSAYGYFVPPIRPTGTRAEIVQHPRQHRIAMALAAGLLASLLSAPVPAQSPPPQYITTVWQTEQGLPQNSVNAVSRLRTPGSEERSKELAAVDRYCAGPAARDLRMEQSRAGSGRNVSRWRAVGGGAHRR